MRGKKTGLLVLGTSIGVLVLLLSFAISSAITPEEIIRIKPFYSADRIPAGSEFKLAIGMELIPGWHVNSNSPSTEFAIPTVVRLNPPSGVKIKGIKFPPAEEKLLPSIGAKTEFYSGISYIIITGETEMDMKPGTYRLKGTFSYQGCSENICLPPADKDITFDLRIAPLGTLVQALNARIFSPQEKETGTVASPLPTASSGPGGEGMVSEMIAEKGLFLSLLLIFIGGLALNLTPCVYPLIPVTLSYFGGMEHRGRGLVNAAAYVSGIVITYSILGTIAALSGKMLGTQLTSPIVTLFIAVVMVLLALSMFGLYEIRVPRFIMNLAGGEARSGIAGALLMGITMGIVAAPCIGPFVVGLLTYVAVVGDPFRGFIMFFFLALGLGFPYLFLAFFSGRISALPRSGEWMIGVRRIFGFILIVMAVYFLDPLISKDVYNLLFSISLVAGGTWLIVFDRSGEKARGFHIFKSLFALGMVILGVWLYQPAVQSTSMIHWQPYSDELIEKAQREGKPVVIDFYADWCIPCKELDNKTFKSPLLEKYAGSFVFLKVDLTQDKSEFTRKIKTKYDIKGVPTVIFIRPDGTENRGIRLTGFENAGGFVKRMESILRPG